MNHYLPSDSVRSVKMYSKFSSQLVLTLLVGIFVSGCNQTTPYYYGNTTSAYPYGYTGGTLATANTFAALQQTVLMPYCLSCHPTAGTGSGGFGVETFADFITPMENGSIPNFVVPGNPSESALYQIVASGQMPPGGSTTGVSQQAAAQIAEWIEAGAPQQ